MCPELTGITAGQQNGKQGETVFKKIYQLMMGALATVIVLGAARRVPSPSEWMVPPERLA